MIVTQKCEGDREALRCTSLGKQATRSVAQGTSDDRTRFSLYRTEVKNKGISKGNCKVFVNKS
ncbi:hypothetical protein [Aetokthonos hydrillicola]|uniref:hypothetical protein n=1 Tax=Aetokthonos hydrillicola TaxID=1550245 RepID=UPI001B191373|nr:hypothetical protein [Aetokthonos hydrillicola CCALA 1050]